MPALIVGTLATSGTKVLRRQDYGKERNGLETLNEAYTIRTVDRLTLQPERGTSHTSFSGASTKFSRMAVETVAFSSMDGDLSEMTVTFVGLTASSGLPPPVITAIPMEGAGVKGPPIQYQIEFLSSLTISQVLFAYPKYSRMPPSINTFSLPYNPPQANEGPFYLGQGTTTYYGYVLRSLQSIERGNFNVITNLYQEKTTNVAIGGTQF